MLPLLAVMHCQIVHISDYHTSGNYCRMLRQLSEQWHADLLDTLKVNVLGLVFKYLQ